jgi:DNA-binding NarL/FixJ family response regulator
MAAAHSGRVDDARAQALALLAEAESLGDDWDRMTALATLGLVELSVGDAGAAATYLERHLATYLSVGRVDPLRAHADYVEVLVELGDLDCAATVAELLSDRAGSSGPTPMRAVAARARSLVSASRDLGESVSAVEEALALHARAVIPFDLARTLLVAGQVRRRRGERRNARDAFERAAAIFGELGSTQWSERAETEARRVPIRRGAGDELTPAELQVAELVAAGRTTREVAQALFVSPKTVEANLTRIYRKLGIRSRAELGAEMALRAKT